MDDNIDANSPQIPAGPCQNPYGFYCPQCLHSDSLSIITLAQFDLTEDGYEVDDLSLDWRDDDSVDCNNCEWGGTVSELVKEHGDQRG